MSDRSDWYELSPPSAQPDGWRWGGDSGTWYIAGVAPHHGEAYEEPDAKHIADGHLGDYAAMSVAWVPDNGSSTEDVFYTHIHGPVEDIDTLVDMIYDDIMDLYG
jgi:hypothetical protein